MKDAEFNLLPSESIILKNEFDDLVLTNLNIISIKRTFFGKVKDIRYFPISGIRQFEGNPSIVITEFMIK